MSRVTFSRETPDVRRAALIAAAADCLAELGPAGTSVRTICARAGVSPGLLRHYFSGVDALIAAAYRATCDQLEVTLDAAIAAAGSNPRDQLIAYLTASLRPPVTDSRVLATWTAFWSLIKTEPAMARIHDESYAAFRHRLEALLAQCGLAERETRSAAIGLTALVDGLWLELSLDPTTFGTDEAVRIATRWLDALLPP